MLLEPDIELDLIQSPLNYTGGKYKLLPQLLPLFPKNIDIFIDNVSKDLQKGLILSFDTEVNRYKTEINKYKAEIDRYKNDINKYNIIVNRINIADILFSISKDNSYIVIMIIGIKIKIKKDSFVKIVSWCIPIKKWRNNFRTKFK